VVTVPSPYLLNAPLETVDRLRTRRRSSHSSLELQLRTPARNADRDLRFAIPERLGLEGERDPAD
jgi:hypothetical protein